jgi:AraC-like DNA-binding protein
MAGDYHLHHVSTLMHVPAVLIEHGIDPVPIFRECGIPISVMLDPDGWVHRDCALAAANRTEELTGDALLGVRQAMKYRLEHLGAWGETIIRSRDLRSAFDFASASIGVIESGTTVRVEELGNKARLYFAFEGRLTGNPRQHIEASLLVLQKIFGLTDENVPLTYHSSRKSYPGADQFEPFFGPQLQFGADSDFIEFDREVLDMRFVRNPDPDASACMETVRKLSGLIRDVMPYERPTLERLANRLKVSVRTLQRRLRDFGFTFETLLDEIRREAALAMIGGSKNNVTETTFLLGYSDVAHFTRAFRRWTGLSPREFGRISRGTAAAAE